MAAKAVVASLILHASVALAVAGGKVGGGHGGDLGRPLETDLIEIESPQPEVAVAEPVPVAAQEESVPTHPMPVATRPAVKEPTHTEGSGTSKGPGKAVVPGAEGGPEAPAAVVAVAASAPARFVMSLGAATVAQGGPAASPTGGAVAEGPGRGEGQGPYPEAGVSSKARLLSGTPPEYPSSARTAGVEADVPLEIVVNAAGSVVDARPLRHIGYGLDEAALRAVRAYRFTPARRDGREVAVRMHWVVDFRLD